MKVRDTFLSWILLAAVAAAVTTTFSAPAFAQDGRGQGRGQGGRGQGAGPAANLPQSPTAVALPKISEPITGPGPIYQSVQSLAPGKDLANFKYEAKEYFISG